MNVKIVAAAVVLSLASACAEDAGPAAPPTTPDASGDSSADAAADSAADAAADSSADTSSADTSSADSASDAGPDAQVGDAASDTTGDTGSDTSGDAGSDADAAVSGVQCSGSPLKFPTFAKACAADADCFVALHQINCCGTLGAFGLATSEKAGFAAAEALCQSQYPDCKCAQQPTQGEDGYTAADGGFAAVCQAGLCRAVVPGAKAECGSAGLLWPKPVKTCQVTADCTYVLKTVDCCGSQVATGITKAAKPAFEAAEAKCAASMAICDCMPKAVLHDDGSSAGDGMTAVQCLDGACSTYEK